jgi:hypothetical protein
MDRDVKWHSLPIGMQIYNIGSEVSRAIRWKNAENYQRQLNFAIKAIELIGLTKMDPKNVKRFDELNFYQQELIDYLFGENMYENTDESIMKIYDQWEHVIMDSGNG